MYIADRQRNQPYVGQAIGPLFEQWYLLHHRMVRIVTNHPALAEQVRSFLYYAELLGEYTYTRPDQLPVTMPEEVFWQAGQRLHRLVALTCYLFQTNPTEPFPPSVVPVRMAEAQWEEISGVSGPRRARWKVGELRYREYEAYPGVSSRICSVLNYDDLCATLYLEDVAACASWFTMRFVFYMVVGALLASNGYEVVHAGAIAHQEEGALIVGTPGSGKSTLVFSCLLLGMSLLADDVLFIAKDDGLVRMYAFPEDIGMRAGAIDLLTHATTMPALTKDERAKRYLAVQEHFRQQVMASCPVRALLFVDAKSRAEHFRVEPISQALAVSLLVREYISHQRLQEDEIQEVFALFSDMAQQARSYRLWLTPNTQENAEQVRRLLAQEA